MMSLMSLSCHGLGILNSVVPGKGNVTWVQQARLAFVHHSTSCLKEGFQESVFFDTFQAIQKWNGKPALKVQIVMYQKQAV